MAPFDTHPTYVVYSPSFDINNGGAIFLHRLVHELRALGEEAFLYPMAPFSPQGRLRRVTSIFQKALPAWKSRLKAFRVSSELSTPVFPHRRIGTNCIAVYPEIVRGNPLRAKKVARWLLYPPGELGLPASFSSNELFFKGSDFSDDPDITGGAQLLQLFWTNPCYRDLGYSDRGGSCYMMRKGASREIVHDLENSRRVDGLTHEELCEEFNKRETFYCYDDATMYSQYAALCGCDSIVIPWHYQCRQEWAAARPIARFGVAYGDSDLEHARRTRHLLSEDLKRLEQVGQETVLSFLRRTREHFGFCHDYN